MSAPILLVDDDPDDAELFRIAAAQAGIGQPILWAANGAAALRLIREGLEPALCLLDIKMPGMSGLELLRLLRADPRTSGLGVIVLSSSDLDSDVAEAGRLGCLLFLTKPPDLLGYFEAAARIKALLPAG